MAEKILNTRLQLKYDSYANWQNSSVILKSGEVAICTIETGVSANGVIKPPAVLMKVGDGSSTFAKLPWLQAVASDVYDWAKAAVKPTYNATEIVDLENYINTAIQDTDTQYTVVAVPGQTYKFNLMSKAKGDDSYSNLVATIDLTEVGSRLDALEEKVGDKAVNEQISDAVALLTFAKKTAGQGQIIDSISQSNGVVTATTRDLVAADIPELAQAKITGLTDALASKQDNLTFEGIYNASSNKVATQSTVSDAIGKLNAEAVSATAGQVIGSVSQANGVVVAQVKTLTKADIPTIEQNQVNGLGDSLAAKQDNLAFTGTYDASKNKVVLQDYVDTTLAGVSGAMHFRGAVVGDTFEEAIAAANAAAIAASDKEFTGGDVVLYGVDEYVYDGASWHVLGNESIYALKADVNISLTDIKDAYKAADAALDSKKQDNLTFDGAYNATSNKVATVSSITTRIAENNTALAKEDAAVANQFVTAVSQENGIINITRAQPTIANIKDLQSTIDGINTNIDKKQDNLTFDGTYNASTNKAATVSTVTNAINALGNEDAAVAKNFVTEVKQTNGAVAVKRAPVADIALSGNVNDLVQTAGDVLVFNCGSSTANV